MCFGCTKAASPMRTGFRALVVWEAGSNLYDLPGWLGLLQVRHRALFSLQFPNTHCLITKLPFWYSVEWKMAFFEVSDAGKQWMAPISPCLLSFLPDACSSGTLLVFAPCTWGLGAQGAALLSAKGPVHIGWFSVTSANTFGTGWHLQTVLVWCISVMHCQRYCKLSSQTWVYDVCSRSPEISISQCNCPWEICYGGGKRGIIMENTLFFKSEWVCANVFPYVNFT